MQAAIVVAKQHEAIESLKHLPLNFGNKKLAKLPKGKQDSDQKNSVSIGVYIYNIIILDIYFKLIYIYIYI